MEDYQKRITIDKPVTEVYAAVTEHIAAWWSNDLAGAAAKAGDSFSIAFGNTRKTFDIVKAIPNEQVVWKCMKAHIDMASLKNKAEWAGTHMVWTISAADGGCVIHFLHEGLHQNLECYAVCEQGWDMFLSSLQQYLITGKGKPYLKAAAKVG